MKCLSPIYLKGNVANPIGYRYRAVPCGRCAACLARKRAAWAFRLQQEHKTVSRSFFLTLTYDEDHIYCKGGIPSLSKDHIQRLFKRLRKQGYVFRYYCVGEYGTHSFRPHYHILFFLSAWPSDQGFYDAVVKEWFYGFVGFGTVSERSIGYTTKYQINVVSVKLNPLFETIQKPFALMSKGIGRNYVERMRSYHSTPEHMYVTYPGGQRGALPRYYADKLYSKEQIRKNYAQINQLEEEICVKYAEQDEPYRYDCSVKEAYSERVFANGKSNAF